MSLNGGSGLSLSIPQFQDLGTRLQLPSSNASMLPSFLTNPGALQSLANIPAFGTLDFLQPNSSAAHNHFINALSNAVLQSQSPNSNASNSILSSGLASALLAQVNKPSTNSLSANSQPTPNMTTQRINSQNTNDSRSTSPMPNWNAQGANSKGKNSPVQPSPVNSLQPSAGASNSGEASANPASTNMVAVELMMNSAVNPDALVNYCNKRFSAYSQTNINIEENQPAVLTVKANKMIEFLCKGQSYSVNRYHLCGHCLFYESRERKAVKRHLECCTRRSIPLHSINNGVHGSSGPDLKRKSPNDPPEDIKPEKRMVEANGTEEDEKPAAEELDFDLDAIELLPSISNNLTIILRIDSQLDPIRIQKFCCKKFSPYADTPDMQITVREDQVTEGLLDFRLNFDITFDRQLLGPDTTRRLYVCGRCLRYQTLKKTHLERHVDSRTCKVRQLTLSRKEASEEPPSQVANLSSVAGSATPSRLTNEQASSAPVQGQEPLSTPLRNDADSHISDAFQNDIKSETGANQAQMGAIVRKSVIPTQRQGITPQHLIKKTSTRSQAPSTPNKGAQDRVAPSPATPPSVPPPKDPNQVQWRQRTWPASQQNDRASTDTVPQVEQAQDVRPTVGQFFMHSVSQSNPAPPIVIQIGSTPVIIHLGGTQPLIVQSPAAPVVLQTNFTVGQRQQQSGPAAAPSPTASASTMTQPPAVASQNLAHSLRTPSQSSSSIHAQKPITVGSHRKPNPPRRYRPIVPSPSISGPSGSISVENGTGPGGMVPNITISHSNAEADASAGQSDGSLDSRAFGSMSNSQLVLNNLTSQLATLVSMHFSDTGLGLEQPDSEPGSQVPGEGEGENEDSPIDLDPRSGIEEYEPAADADADADTEAAPASNLADVDSEQEQPPEYEANLPAPEQYSDSPLSHLDLTNGDLLAKITAVLGVVQADSAGIPTHAQETFDELEENAHDSEAIDNSEQ